MSCKLAILKLKDVGCQVGCSMLPIGRLDDEDDWLIGTTSNNVVLARTSNEKDFRIRSLASSFSDRKIRKARANPNATSCIFFSGMMFVRRSQMVNK